MVAQQKLTPEIGQMGQTDQMGQRARRTIPMIHERRPLSTATQLMTRDACWRCEGRGTLDGEFMACQVCGRRYSREQVEQEANRFFRNVLLPCGHGIRKNEIDYRAPDCPACYGSPVGPGYLPRWPTVEDLLPVIVELLPQLLPDVLPALIELIEQYYADLSAKSTAVRATQAAQVTQIEQRAPQRF